MFKGCCFPANLAQLRWMSGEGLFRALGWRFEESEFGGTGRHDPGTCRGTAQK